MLTENAVSLHQVQQLKDLFDGQDLRVAIGLKRCGLGEKHPRHESSVEHAISCRLAYSQNIILKPGERSTTYSHGLDRD